MAESSLSLVYEDYMKEISVERGWGRSVPTGDDLITAQADMAAGLRMFYSPPPLTSGKPAHRWAFLRPVTSLTTSATGTADTTSIGPWLVANEEIFTDDMKSATVTFTVSENTYTISSVTDSTHIVIGSILEAGVDDIEGAAFTVTDYARFDLPDDFAGLYGPLTYAPTTGYPPIEVVGEAEIRTKEQYSESSGRPLKGAVRWKAPDTTGQRWELMLWPKPDQAYTVYYRYTILLDTLSAGQYPPGGMQHSQTILAAMRAAVEDHIHGAKGSRWETFIERLGASVQIDRDSGTPECYGYMGDGRAMVNMHDHDVTMKYNDIDYS